MLRDLLTRGTEKHTCFIIALKEQPSGRPEERVDESKVGTIIHGESRLGNRQKRDSANLPSIGTTLQAPGKVVRYLSIKCQGSGRDLRLSEHKTQRLVL